MLISVEDRLDIHELIALHGHLSDAGDFGRKHEVFADDVVYDLTDFGRGSVHGRDALRDMALALGGQNPVGHHTTNVVIAPIDGDTARGAVEGHRHPNGRHERHCRLRGRGPAVGGRLADRQPQGHGSPHPADPVTPPQTNPPHNIRSLAVEDFCGALVCRGGKSDVGM